MARIPKFDMKSWTAKQEESAKNYEKGKCDPPPSNPFLDDIKFKDFDLQDGINKLTNEIIRSQSLFGQIKLPIGNSLNIFRACEDKGYIIKYSNEPSIIDCLHEYVDVGFHHSKFVCKNCDKDKI